MNRKALLLLVKVCVLLLAGFWLSRKADLSRVWQILSGASLPWFCAAFGFLLLNLAPVSLRWKILLEAIGIPASAPALARIAQIGQFFSVLLPGAAGDDVTRMVYVAKLAPARKREACATVLIDRGVGFASLFVLVLLCLPRNWELLTREKQALWLGAASGAVGACVLLAAAVFLLCKRETLSGWVRSAQARRANSGFLNDLFSIADTLIEKRSVLLKVGLLAICTQIAGAASFCAAGIAAGVHLSLPQWMAFVPIIAASNILPITFSGIGVRDYLLLLFVASGAGFETDRVLAVSVLILALSILSAFLGGVVYLLNNLLGKSSENPRPVETAPLSSPSSAGD